MSRRDWTSLAAIALLVVGVNLVVLPGAAPSTIGAGLLGLFVWVVRS